MNIALLSGKIFKTDVRHTTTGKMVVTVTMTTSKKTKDGFTNEFHKIVCWEKLGEKVQFSTKDTPIFVKGSIETNSYEKNGTKVYSTQIVAQDVICGAQAVAHTQDVVPEYEPEMPF